MITSLPSSSATSHVAPDRQSPNAAGAAEPRSGPSASVQTPNGASSTTEPRGTRGTSGNRGAQLSEADQQRVRELQQRDREVRAHELAHVAAGAGLILRGASFTYDTGPDGQRYAIGGEVTIDTSPGKTAEETLSKASRIKAAALAPADPSPQDMQVAGKADMMAADARAELVQQTREESAGDTTQAQTNSTEPAAGDTNATGRRMRSAYTDAAIAASGLRDRTFSAYA